MTKPARLFAFAGIVLAATVFALAAAQLSVTTSQENTRNGAIGAIMFSIGQMTTPISTGTKLQFTLPSYLILNRFAPTKCSLTATSELAISTRTTGNDINIEFLTGLTPPAPVDPPAPPAPVSLSLFCTNIGNPDKATTAKPVEFSVFAPGNRTAAETFSSPLADIIIPDVPFGEKKRLISIPNNRVNRVNDISISLESVPSNTQSITVLLPGGFSASAQGTATTCRVPTVRGTTTAANVERDGVTYLSLSFKVETGILGLPLPNIPSSITMRCTAIRAPTERSEARNNVIVLLERPAAIPLPVPPVTPGNTNIFAPPTLEELVNPFVTIPAIVDDLTDSDNELKVLFFTIKGPSGSRPVASFSVDNFIWPFMENDLVGLFFPDGASVWPDVSCNATYMGSRIEPLVEFASSSSLLFKLGAGLGDPPSPATTPRAFPSLGSIADFNVVCSGIGPDIDFDFETGRPFTSSLRAIRTASRTLREVIDPDNNPFVNIIRNLEIEEFIRETRFYEWASGLDWENPLRYFRNFAEFGRDLFSDFREAIEDIGEDLYEAGKDVGEALVDAGTDVGEAIVDAGEEVGEAIRDGAEEVGDAVSDVVTFKADQKAAKRKVQTQQVQKKKTGPFKFNAKQLAQLKARGQAFRAKMAQKFSAKKPERKYAAFKFAAKRDFKNMNVLDDITGGVTGGIGDVADGAAWFIRGSADVISSGIRSIPDLFERGREIFGDFFDPLSEEFRTFLDISVDTAERFRDELRSLQFLSRASDELETVLRDAFRIDEWPDSLEDALDEFRDLTADFREVFMDISVPSSIENAWRRIVDAGESVYNEIRHSVGRIGSVGDLFVELRDLVEEIPSSSLITVPLGGIFDVTDFTRCTINNVATTFLRELANGFEVVLRIRVPGRVTGNSATINCSDVAVTSTEPDPAAVVPSNIGVESPSGAIRSLGAVSPFGILGTAQLGSNTRGITHSSSTSYSSGTLSLTLSPMGTAANKVVIKLPQDHLIPDAGGSTSCDAAVGSVPVLYTQTSVTSNSITVSATELVLASAANLANAPLQISCTNVRRGRFVHGALNNIVVEAYSGDSLVGSTSSATLSAVTHPNPMAGTSVTLVASSTNANEVVTVTGTISQLPFDIVADDRVVLAIPSPWTIPTDGTVQCSVKRKDSSAVGVTGAAYVSGHEVTVRLAGDIAANQAPFSISCSGIRNPSTPLQSSSANGIYFAVKDSQSRNVMATTNGVTSHYTDTTTAFGDGTSVVPLQSIKLGGSSSEETGSGLAIRFRSPMAITVNDVIEVILPDSWSVQDGIDTICTQGGIRSQLSRIIDRDGLRVLQITLPIAVPTLFVAQTIICTGIEVLSTVGNAVLGLVSSGATTVQEVVPILDILLGQATFTHEFGTANAMGSMTISIPSIPIDLPGGSSVLFELPAGWRVSTGTGATTCNAMQGTTSVTGTTEPQASDRSVKFTVGGSGVGFTFGSTAIVLTCTNIGAPNVATAERNDVHYSITPLGSLVAISRYDGKLGAIAPADLNGKVSMASSSLATGAMSSATFQFSPAVVDVLTNDVIQFALPAGYEVDVSEGSSRTSCSLIRSGNSYNATAALSGTALRVTVPSVVGATDNFSVVCDNIRNPSTPQSASTFTTTIFEGSSANARGVSNDVTAPAIAPNEFGEDFLYLIPDKSTSGQGVTMLLFSRPFTDSSVAGTKLRIALPNVWTAGDVACRHTANPAEPGGTTQVIQPASATDHLAIEYTFTETPSKDSLRLYCSGLTTPASDRPTTRVAVDTYSGAERLESSQGLLAPITTVPSTYVVQNTVTFPRAQALPQRLSIRLRNAMADAFSSQIGRTEIFRQTLAQSVQGQNMLTLTFHGFPKSDVPLDAALEAVHDGASKITQAVRDIAGVSADSISVKKPAIYAMPDTCSDGETNAGETGTDCGGGVCNQCLGQDTCLESTDCVSGECDAVSRTCRVVSAASPANSVTYYISFLAAPIIAALIAYISAN